MEQNREVVKKSENVEFSREETEKFTSLIEDITPDYYRLSEEFFSKENFLSKWRASQRSPENTEDLFNIREKWMWIKKEGVRFEQFIEERILSTQEENTSIFIMLKLYCSLNPDNRIPFFSKLLSHEQIWNNNDNSCAYIILWNLRNYGGDESTVKAIQQYIENMYSAKYHRSAYIENDVYSASRALIAIAGKEQSLFLLSGLSRKIPAFASFIENKEDELFADEIKPATIIEPFDLNAEEERSKQLEQQLKELKKNGPSFQEENEVYDPDSYERERQTDDQENQFQPTFHHKEIKKLRAPIENILEKLKPKIEAGEYGIIFGDDASGRIPALLFNKIISGLYDEYGYKHPAIYFLTGSRFLSYDKKEEKKALIRSHLDRISMTERPNGISGRALLVTDTIATGQSLEPLIEALKEKEIDFDIVSIGDCSDVDLSQKWRKNVYYGMKGTPDIYKTSHLSGVVKYPTDLFSEKIKTEEGSQSYINEAREDISFLANEILKKMKDTHNSQN